jgi:hypothetical protein
MDHTETEVASAMRKVLKGNAPIPQQLAAHQTFLGKVLEGDWEKGIVQAFMGEAAVDPKWLRIVTRLKDGKFDPNGAGVFKGTNGLPEDSKEADRGRVKRPKDQKAVEPRPGPAGLKDPTGNRKNPDKLIKDQDEAKEAGTDQSVQRGIDTFTMDEGAEFCQRARLKLDMPLAAGVSGSTAELVNCAITMGLGGDQLAKYALGVLGYIAGGGNHSFVEIVTVLQAATLKVDPDSYDGIVPTLMDGARMEKLKKKFPKAFKTPDPAAKK